MNKIDSISMEELDLLDRMPHYVPISANLEWNLDSMLEKCWEYLDLVRMYVKIFKVNGLDYFIYNISFTF